MSAPVHSSCSTTSRDYMTVTSPGTRSFFKYAAPETALAVLRNKSVRYSSPLKFNDPFDFQSGLHFDFDLDTLRTRIYDKLDGLVAAREAPVVDAQDPWGKIVLFVREKYPTHGFPRERLEQITAPFKQSTEMPRNSCSIS